MNTVKMVDCFKDEATLSVETAAMLLAITRSLNTEKAVKALLDKDGLRHVVTEIGGLSHTGFQEKTTKAILGACLNTNIIKKTTQQVHAVLHATEEAKKGILVNASTSTSLAVKVAIVRDDTWIAVAMFGQSAIHPLTNHMRAGLGVMHIC